MSAVHADPATLWARLLRRTVRTEAGCWIFTGATNTRGYGSVSAGKSGFTILAHRLAVIARDGGIPDDMTVDHGCHDSYTCPGGPTCPHRRCVNPEHLRVMTSGDNIRRLHERGTCRKGHPLVKRAKGWRVCRTCAAQYARDLRAAKKVRQPA